MKVSEMFERLAPNLIPIIEGKTLYVYDDMHDDRSNDYGIFDHVPLDEIKENGITIDSIPEYLIDDAFAFLYEDELPHHYGITKDVLNLLPMDDYSSWADILKEHGYDKAYESLKDICGLFKADGHTEPITEEEIKKFGATDEHIKMIRKYDALKKGYDRE